MLELAILGLLKERSMHGYQLKKHLAWYARGFPGAAALRESLFALPTPAAVQSTFWESW